MELLRGGFACIGLGESKLFLVATLFHLPVFFVSVTTGTYALNCCAACILSLATEHAGTRIQS